jgi:hypothetical protein
MDQILRKQFFSGSRMFRVTVAVSPLGKSPWDASRNWCRTETRKRLLAEETNHVVLPTPAEGAKWI